MSNLNSYNILINRFKAFADGHFLLKNFTYGAITLADLQKFGLYPFMHIVPVDVSYESGVKNFSFDVFFADLPRDEENKAEYQKETLSDLQQIAEDLLGEITNHRVLFGKDVSVISSRLVPFEEEFSNVLTGWNLSITLQIPYNWNACDIPASFNDYIVYNQSTGESSVLEFKDSIVREGGEVRLVNDLEFPPASYYYGTDENGNRGWFVFPTDEVGLTCETLGACDTIVDIQTNITNLENDVEDLSANVVDIQMDITTIEGNITTLQSDVSDLETEVGLKANTSDISAVGFSNDYNDLDNLPTIPDSTSDLINDSGFITINDVPTSVSVVAHEVKLGSTMSKGTPVYVSSADGTNMIVSPASNTSEATSSKTLGLLMEGGNTNAKVQVITEGLLDGLDTSTATIGDAVWLGSTGTLIYGLANKPVAPLHLVFIGIVTRVNTNNGEIFVKVQNGFELQEIHNVLIESVANNEGLFYDSATSLWKNKTIENVLGYTPFNLPSLTSGSVLFSNGTTIAQDNANLFWDNVNNRLGIGTTTPTTSLSIFGTNELVQIGDGSQANSSFISFNGSRSQVGYKSSGLHLITSSGRALVFGTGTFASTTVWGMFFATTGNLGINTTTDSGFRFDVNGTARIQNQLTTTGSINASSLIARGTFLNQTLVATANNDVLVGLDIATTFTTGAFTGVENIGARLTIGTGILKIANRTANAISFHSGSGALSGTNEFLNSDGSNTWIGGNQFTNLRVAGSDRLKVFNTGNVVIQNGGTFTDAGYRLDVNGATRLQSSLLVAGLISASGGITSSLTGYGYSISTNANFTNDTTRLSQSPATWIWHDLFAFNRYNATYETYNGTTWSSATLNTELFAQKQNQSIQVINTTILGSRWTFNGTDWGNGTWLVIGVGYDVSLATYNVLVESWNGSVWTTRHTSNTNTQANNYFAYVTSYGGDTQIRVSITKTGGGNNVNISSIKLLTARPGDQGVGSEVEFPYYWNGARSIGIGTSSSINASAILDIGSTTKGVLFPRMTTTQKNAIVSATAGLVVYDTTTNKLCCYNGTTWNDLF